MKKIYLRLTGVLVCLLLFGTGIYAQVPEGFSYQAIARDNEGTPLVDENLLIRIAILSSVSPDVVLWEEEHSVSTNSFGLFNLTVGSSSTQTDGTLGSFTEIDWSSGDFFLRPSIKETSGSWEILEASRIQSVPFAMATKSHSGGKLEVVSIDDESTDALFEVKRKDGQPVFSVFPNGIEIHVDDVSQTAKGARGGFSVAGFNKTKGSQEYLYVTPDSIRMYIPETDDQAGKGLGSRGGFAVAGFNPGKGVGDLYLNVTGTNTADIFHDVSQVLWYPRKEAFLAGNIHIGGADSVGHNSTAIGFRPIAMGDYSQAFGYKSLARGVNSTAIGNLAKATGVDSYAFGSGAEAIGDKSFALGSVGVDSLGNPMGASTKAAGNYAMAMGMSSQASQLGALSIGVNSMADGLFATAIGYRSISSAPYSHTFGLMANSYGDRSMALGMFAKSGGLASLSLGYGSRATGDYSVAIGYYAQSIGDYSASFGASAYALSDYSYAIGRSAEARNMYAYAIGYDAYASGSQSTAIGTLASATNSYGTAIGRSSQATGNTSTAIGFDARATSTDAYAFGRGSRASNSNAYAIGRGAVASGPTSLSLGYQSSATSDYAVAIGRSSTASGETSTAIGYEAIAGGDISTAIGYKTSANGTKSISIGANYTKSNIFIPLIPIIPIFPIIPLLPKGDEPVDKPLIEKDTKDFIIIPTSINRDNVAEGEYSVAIGNGNLATNGGLTFGVYNDATDVYATAIGFANNSIGRGSFASGYGNTATGDFSSAMGRYTVAESENSFAIGRYNTVSGTVDSWVQDEPLFQIGNGTSSTNTHDALLVRKNGYTTITSNGNADVGLWVKNVPGASGGFKYGLVSQVFRNYASTTYYSGWFYDSGSAGTYNGLYADIRTGGAIDLAEYIYDNNNETEPADVVVADLNGKENVIKSTKPYQTAVVGIVSTKPHLTMGMELVIDEKTGIAKEGVHAARLALAGRVPCKVTDENGPIKPGDMLTSSSTPGHAMKWSLLDVNSAKNFEELKSVIAENERRRNAIIGKALEGHSSGSGKIVVLVSLQ